MKNHVNTHKAYVPAAGKDWLLPLYDPAVKLLGLDHFYYRLIECAKFVNSPKILDIGCGTGSFAKLVKQIMPFADITGIDPDPKALAVAAQKLRQYPAVQLDLGEAYSLPYADRSFDYVVSSFVFHHLPQTRIPEMFREVQRVLKTEGVFWSVDFSGSARAQENITKSICLSLVQAGFNSIKVDVEKHWLLGRVSIYSAT